MSNMKDVAILADVSVATVSNYINKTRNVKASTAKKIEDAIMELKFLPDIHAKNLKTGKSNEIGVILPYIDDSYYSLVLKGIERKFNELGYFIQVAFTENNPEKENILLDYFLSKSKAGLILVTSQPNNTKFFKRKLSSIPYVLLDRRIKSIDSNLIVFDNYRSIKHIVNNMIAIGKRKIVLITGDHDYYSEKECIKGYKAAFGMAELEVSEQYIIETDFSKEEAFKNIIRLLEEGEIESVITSSTNTALGALEALYIRNVDDLENIKVICLGEAIWNKHSNLIGIKSTMRAPFNMGLEAAKLLNENINRPSLFEKKTFVLPDRITTIKKLDFEESRDIVHHKIAKKLDKSIEVLLLKGPGTIPIKGLLPNFVDQTGIDVKITSLEQGEMYEALIADAISETPKYDVVMYDLPWLKHLAKHKVVRDITDLCQEHKIGGKQYLDGITSEFCEYKNKIYSLPFIFGPQLLFYRKDLFEDINIREEYLKKYKVQLEPPKNWLEFNTIAEFFTKRYNPNSPVTMGTIIANDSPYRICPEFYMRLWTYGGVIMDELGMVNKDTEAYKKAMKNLKEVLDFLPENSKINSLEETVQAFSNGDVAMLNSYATYIPDVNNRCISKVAGKIGYCHVPGLTPVLSGWSLGVGYKSSKVEEAFSFIKWASGESMQDYFTILRGTSPNKNVYENDDLTKMYPWFDLLKETLDHSKNRRFPAGKNINDNIQLRVESMIAEEVIGLCEKVDKS